MTASLQRVAREAGLHLRRPKCTWAQIHREENQHRALEAGRRHAALEHMGRLKSRGCLKILGTRAVGRQARRRILRSHQTGMGGVSLESTFVADDRPERPENESVAFGRLPSTVVDGRDKTQESGRAPHNQAHSVAHDAAYMPQAATTGGRGPVLAKDSKMRGTCLGAGPHPQLGQRLPH